MATAIDGTGWTDRIIADPAMTAAESAAEIGILLYPGVQLAAVHGLTDLFAMAGWVVSTHGGPRPGQIRVTHWRAETASGAIACVFDSMPVATPNPSYLLVPSSFLRPPSPEAVGAVAGWLRERHAAGVVIASNCLAAFLLAEAGLLSGRRVTTHWHFAAALAERFPDIVVDGDKLIIDEGDIITAGGLHAWGDLGLRLVGRVLSPAVAVMTARYLLLDFSGREQRHYSAFAPRLHHGDDAVLAVQRWLQSEHAGPVSLEAMADRAGMTARTLLRRFRKATGLTPIAYHQHLRMTRAREILESSTKSLKNVAWDIGYGDVTAFNRTFRRVMGIAPAEYRRRFGPVSAA